MAKLIQVIEAWDTRGSGTEALPKYTVVQYFTTDGTLLAERSDWMDQRLNDLAYDAGGDKDTGPEWARLIVRGGRY